MDAAVTALSREIAEIERTAVTPVDDLLAGVNLRLSHPCRQGYSSACAEYVPHQFSYVFLSTVGLCKPNVKHAKP